MGSVSFEEGEVGEQLEDDCNLPPGANPSCVLLCQDPGLGDPSPPCSPLWKNPRPEFGVGEPAFLPGGGAWLAQDPQWGLPVPSPKPPGPGSGPPPLLAGSLLLAVCSRSGAERAPPKPPPLLVPLQALHKSSPTPPHSPQPTSSSPRGTLPVPFMFPLRGDLPFHCRRQLLVSQPLKHGCGPACWPPLQGGRGGTSRGKGQLCHLPRVLNGGLSQAINARPTAPLC